MFSNEHPRLPSTLRLTCRYFCIQLSDLNMKRSLLTLMIFSLIGIASLQAQNLNKVYGAMAEEDWEVALQELEPILAKKKKNYEAMWLAGICHTKRYRMDKAFELFKEALPLAEELPYFWIPYAEAYLVAERVDDAERTLRRLNVNSLEDADQADWYALFNKIQNARKYLSNPKDIIIKNLGPNVNTEGNEYSQVVTANQMGIYFTARRDGLGKIADDGENYEMVMTAEMDDLDKWKKDRPLDGFSARDANEAPVQLTNGDSTLLTFLDEDLYISYRQADGTWGKRQPLPINTNKWDSHAFLYNNGNSMIYASSFGNDDENSDLYIVHKNADGSWTKPYFIEELNTPEREDAPFVAEDGTLYFSSQGHDSMGGYDIFSTRLDSATGKFSEPQNMGAPINLPNDDTFFTLYGKNAYLSSSRPDGYGQVDIYRIIMFNKSQLQGKLLDCDNETPVAYAEIKVTTEDGDELTTTTDEYGVYKMVMPIERDFTLSVSKDDEVLYEKEHAIRVLFRDEFDVEQDFYIGCDRVEKEIYVKMINSFDLDPTNVPVPPVSTEGVQPVVEEEEEPIVEVIAEDPVVPDPPVVEEKTEALPPAVTPENIELPMVYFDFDKHNIKSEFFKRLDEAAELLVRRRDLRIMVAGHTDAYGTNPYNVALGRRRYTEVYNYLINKGVNPEQLETKTFSEDIPVASNRTVQGRAFNRRVELYFIDEDGNRVDY